jgi:hypothetical protein
MVSAVRLGGHRKGPAGGGEFRPSHGATVPGHGERRQNATAATPQIAGSGRPRSETRGRSPLNGATRYRFWNRYVSPADKRCTCVSYEPGNASGPVAVTLSNKANW